jgi:hypothetical protein
VSTGLRSTLAVVDASTQLHLCFAKASVSYPKRFRFSVEQLQGVLSDGLGFRHFTDFVLTDFVFTDFVLHESFSPPSWVFYHASTKRSRKQLK